MTDTIENRQGDNKDVSKKAPAKYKNVCVTLKSELCDRFESRIGLVRRSTAIAYLIEEYLKTVEEKEKNDDSARNHHDNPLAKGGLL